MGIRHNYVVILTTRDTDAQDSLALLSEHIPTYYGAKCSSLMPVSWTHFHDVDTDQAALEFMTQACSALPGLPEEKWEIYACIAGGRKVMSALLALAVQFYGCQYAFPCSCKWPRIEERGHISKLKNISTECRNRIFHPHVDKVRSFGCHLWGYSLWLSRIWLTLNGKSDHPEIKGLLEQNGSVGKGTITWTRSPCTRDPGECRNSSPPSDRSEECAAKVLHIRNQKNLKLPAIGRGQYLPRFLFVERIEDIGVEARRAK